MVRYFMNVLYKTIKALKVALPTIDKTLKGFDCPPHATNQI